MTISLLRRIWQTIHVEHAAAPARQRLTGFEPLEPRMVLSGFMAYYTPDYLSPPPGDFSHAERTGAEIARPLTGFADYNSLERGLGEGGPEFRSIQVQPLFTGLENPAFNERLLSGRGSENWLSGASYVSPLDSVPLSNAETGDGTSYEVDGDSPSGITIIDVPTQTSISYISFNALAIDRVLADLRPVTLTASFNSLSPMGTMSAMSSGFRSLTDRDYNSVNAGGAVEHHEEAHEYGAPHSTTPDASLALVARPATPGVERGTSNSANDPALASQAALGVNSVTVPADGSTANGQPGAVLDGSLDRQQDGLLELSEGELLKLKRKLAGSTTEIDEASSSTTDRSDQYGDSDAQVAYDPTRPFDVTAIPNGQLRQVAGENLADDGLIEVLAADVTAIIASREVIDQAAANRQITMEPAVATYQAFEVVVVDGDAGVATDVVADAARLAGAVAMNGQPVVQAE
jgi:hypothetical protein